jgi:hypothetical protein
VTAASDVALSRRGRGVVGPNSVRARGPIHFPVSAISRHSYPRREKEAMPEMYAPMLQPKTIAGAVARQDPTLRVSGDDVA